MSPATPAVMDDICSAYATAAQQGPDAIVALCTEDVVWSDPSLPGPLHGREAVRAFLTGLYDAFLDLKIVDSTPPHRSVSPDGSLVAWHWHSVGRMALPGGGEHVVEIPGVDLWRLRDGQIAEYHCYYDTAAVAPPQG